MLLVEEGVERSVVGLDLRLAGSAKEAMSLGEVNSMVQHVQLGEGGDGGLRSPVAVNITHHAAPGVDVGCCPVTRAQQAIMQLLQPAGEDGVRSGSSSREGGRRCGSCQHTGTAFLLDPFADLLSVEVIQVSGAAAASRMDRGDAFQRLLDALLAQQLAECVEDDAVADAEKKMERSGHDALGWDGEESRWPTARECLSTGVR